MRFDVAGLVPAIAQDADSGAVLMMAWMDRDALIATLTTGAATYSRSRGRQWVKGESPDTASGCAAWRWTATATRSC